MTNPQNYLRGIKKFSIARTILAVVVIGTAIILTLWLSLSQGAVPLSFAELWQALLHQGDPVKQTILWDLRLPRIVAAITVGAA